MRKYFAYSLFVISFLTIVLWIINEYIRPILPINVSGGAIIFFVSLTTTLGILSGLKSTIDLLEMFSSKRKKSKTTQIQHNLPQPDYERFIGRKEEIKKIKELLSSSTRHFVITIDGVGGVGKTALALEAAYEHIRRYKRISKKDRFNVIVWATAKKSFLSGDGIIERHQSLHNLKDIYSAICWLLKRPDILKADGKHQDNLIRHALTQQRTLLIIDNLETVDDERMLSFVKDVPSPTKVLITTRHRIDVAFPIRLLGMNEAEAKELIADECKKKNVHLSDENKEKLFKRTGGIPLAIAWSIAQMGLGYRPDTVLTRLGEPTSDIAKFCFEGVMDQIRGKSEYKLLMALAFLDNNADRKTLGDLTGLAELDRDEGLMMLEKLSLVSRAENIFSILPLTMTYSKAELSKNQTVWLEITRPYINSYIEHIKKSVGILQIYGMASPLDLDKIYIPLKLKSTAKSDTENDSKEELKDPFKLLEKETKIYLLGGPGTGKTTFLKYIALKAVSNTPTSIPFLITLRNFSESNHSIFDYILTSFEIVKLPSPKNYVNKLLETGNAIILFDGLDEINVKDNKRNEISAKIEQFVNTYDKCKYIITCRTAASSYVFQGFYQLELAEFDDQQITEFIHHWFKDYPRGIEPLRKILKSQKRLLQLTSNPLLLTLISMVFQQQGHLPTRRSDIFEEGIQILFHTWDTSRRITRGGHFRRSSPNLKIRMLSFIAAKTFEKNIYHIPLSILERYVIEFFESPEFTTGIDKIDPTDLVREIATQHGILVERQYNIYSFLTLSFHEYFTSKYIVYNNSLEALFNHTSEPRWREVFLFVVELLDDATEFFNLLLEQIEEYKRENSFIINHLNKHVDTVSISNVELSDYEWDRVKNYFNETGNFAQDLSKYDSKLLSEFLYICNLLIECLESDYFSNRSKVRRRFVSVLLNKELSK